MAAFFIFATIALVALTVVVARRNRRTSNTGDRPADVHKANWIHKSEGI